MEDEYLRIEGISKRYGVVEALKNVSFSVRRGEIHTLLGENGAGKSTLVKVVKGEVVPDSGSLFLDGKKIEKFSPGYAMDLGISMVHQELSIFENLTVAENIFPAGTITKKFNLVDKKTLNQKSTESLKLFDINIDPSEKMENLSLAEQQMIEILRAISSNQKIILLDEPTSGLKKDEIKKLMQILKKLRADGLTIFYISHIISEILDLSDRITVLRDGEFVTTLVNSPDLTENDLISQMVGREFSDDLYLQKQYGVQKRDEVFFKVKNASQKKSLSDISFELYKGEILGFFGLEGAGTSALSKMIFGLAEKQTGRFFVKGQEVKKITPAALIASKIMYLNKNRKKAGLLFGMPAADNMALPVMQKMSAMGFLLFSKIAEYTRKNIEKFAIVIPHINTKPQNLSGGNQQKLMMATCFGTDPECVIINEPTRGIDVGAKAEIHKVILALAQKGTSIILISSELPELISLSDRVIVMKNKKFSGELCGNQISQEKIMSLAAGETGRGIN
jgi:ABC-type sugar transport system ATPase subunit